jgi:hypothetical protein
MALALQEHRDRLCIIVGAKNAAALAMGNHTESPSGKFISYCRVSSA